MVKILIIQGVSAFSRWHLFCQHEPKNPTLTSWIFSFVSAGHNITSWYTQHHLTEGQHHFEQSENIIVRLRTQMNEVALRANDVLRNDVGLRPTMLRFAQSDFAEPLAPLPKVCYNKIRKAVEQWIFHSSRLWTEALIMIEPQKNILL